MRTLETPPASIFDAASGLLLSGSFRGGLPRVDLRSPGGRAGIGGRLRQIAQEKRWFYVGISTPELYVGVAVVKLGYVSNAFAFVLDAKAERLLADETLLAPPTACTVGRFAGEGCVARLESGARAITIDRPRGAEAYDVRVRTKTLSLDARLDAAHAPSPIAVIAPLGDGRMNATEKRTLLRATGEVRVGGGTRSLDGALAGYDYTHGLLPRRTQWRWAFALGRAKSGEAVAWNLVEGFVGEPECAVWVDGDLYPLPEGRFAFDSGRPLGPWTVRTADDAVDLRFTPYGMHADDTNLGIVRSRFVQPAGAFSGTIRAGGRTLELERVLGVTEDQDVVW